MFSIDNSELIVVTSQDDLMSESNTFAFDIFSLSSRQFAVF